MEGAGNAIPHLTLFAYGSRLLLRGDMTTGGFFAFWQALSQMTWPMISMGFFVSVLQRGRASKLLLAIVFLMENAVFVIVLFGQSKLVFVAFLPLETALDEPLGCHYFDRSLGLEGIVHFACAILCSDQMSGVKGRGRFSGIVAFFGGSLLFGTCWF